MKLPTNRFQLKFKPSSVFKLYEYLRHLAYDENEEISKFEFNWYTTHTHIHIHTHIHPHMHMFLKQEGSKGIHSTHAKSCIECQYQYQ